MWKYIHAGSILEEWDNKSATQVQIPIPTNDLYLRLFSEKERQDDAKLSSGGGRMKMFTRKSLREKAADMNILSGFGSAVKRKSEAKLVELRRELGLHTVEDVYDDGSDVRSQSDCSSVGEGLFSSVDPLYDIAHVPHAEQCRITVCLVRLKGLQSSTLFGYANPYVAFTLGSSRIKTQTVWGSNSPSWDSSALSVVFFASKDRLHQLHMNIKVFDKERIRRKKQLGAVSIGLSTLNLHDIDSWFALEGPEAKASEIYLKISVSERVT